MRKSLNTSLSDSLSTTRVFGIPLEEVQHSGQPGHEVPLLVRSIVEYIEEHGESGGTLLTYFTFFIHRLQYSDSWSLLWFSNTMLL
uniref:Rho-GAP domain-containing protein n=1 Tax=Sinocyclocheilus rhinocerous TaxID=307959 RepID=A0A673MZN4_9TELE